MSLGSVIGGIVGGIAGFFIGGPMGALYGASIGFGLGAMVDPMTPDIPSVGAPAPEVAAMKSTIGDPCPDLCGTSKVTGHLIAYGAEKSVAIYSEPVSGGKGGPPEPEPQVVGYDYYMSWQLGLLRGPISTLYAIYKNEDLLWEGPLELPASGGHETISIEGFGAIDFYFGTDDQVPNSKVGSIISDSTLNSPLRNYCWAFMDNCKIGNYPRTPSLSFVVKKIPEYSWSSQNTIQEYDCNPMHAIYYLLRLGGLPTSWLDEDDFASIGTSLYIEFRGISILLNSQAPVLQYVETINSHIDNILKYGIDGKFHPVLIRDDYNINTIPVINEDNMLDDPSIIRPSWIDTINEIKSQYSEIYNVTREKILDGPIWSCGYNSRGQYGDISVAPSSTFVLANTISLVSIIAGNNNLYGMTKGGLIYGSGNNSQGQMGTGDNANLDELTLLSNIIWEKIDYLESSGLTLVGITINGEVWGTGYNVTGMLATNDYGYKYEFTRAGYMDPDLGYTPVKAYDIACGNMHSVIINMFDGNVWGVGNRSNGAIGDGYTGTSSSYQRYYIPITYQPEGADDLIPFTASKLWGGYLRTFAIHQGEFWGTGNNLDGALGLSSSIARVSRFRKIPIPGIPVQVSSNRYATCVLLSNGTIWGTGSNEYGSLGQGDNINKYGFVQIGSDSDWAEIRTNGVSTSARKKDGSIWSCGYGRGGILGLGNSSNYNTLQPVPDIKFLKISIGSSSHTGIKL